MSLSPTTPSGVATRNAEDPELEHRELLDFVENVPMALHRVGADGTILWANQAQLDLLGYARDEYVGHHISEFHADPAVVADILDRLGRGEVLSGYASRLLCRDGSVKDVAISSNTRRRDGEFVHTRCVTVDMTEHRQAEESRALLAAIVATSEDAIVSKGLDGVIRSWNRAAERLFGYSAREAVGQPIDLIIPHELRSEERRILEHLRRGKTIEHFETVRVAKDGTRLDISLTISPVRDSAGRIIGASKIARDVGERKRAQQALRESEERFRAIVESQAEMICRFRIDGTLLFVNDAFARALGTTPDAATARSFWEFVAEADRPKVRARLDKLTPEHPEVRIENRFHTARGERWTLWTNRALTFDADGRVREAQSAGIDITDRKRAEEALLEADRRKNEFLATLGHELRNPLAPIRNMLDVLRQSDRDTESRHLAYEMMTRQLDGLVRLVDDLLDVSRITEGKLELQRERVELGAVVRSAADDSRAQIDAAAQELSLDVPEEPLYVHGDQLRLYQVLTNLLSNATKYTPDGGHIELGVAAEGPEARITVRDDGFGIPAGRLESIFETFSQVDHSVERGHKGLGIGLSLVKWLVEMHGGHVEARSDGPGRGSEFTVRLPVAAGEEAALPDLREPAAADAAGLSVLVVDDNADAARSLGMLLENLGHDARFAFDGLEACDAAAGRRPDVVLLDIGLPGLSGYDVARRLRSQPGGERITIAAVTGWGQEADRELALEAGCDVHVTKPLTLRTLRTVLDSVDGRQPTVQ